MKNILVTGASRGLGLSITKNLIQNGYSIYAINRTISNDLNRLSLEHPDNLHIIKFDLEDIDAMNSFVFKNEVGFDLPIHGLINNAAIAYDDLVTNINYKSLEKMFKINVFAPMILTKYVIRNMLLHDIRGSIVHISSISAHTGYKGLAMYASSKGSIEAFSLNTAREWGERGIRSNSIVAGFMETDMNKELSNDQKKRIFNRTCLKRSTDIDSVSKTAKFLISDDSLSITGQNIFVDSGTI